MCGTCGCGEHHHHHDHMHEHSHGHEHHHHPDEGIVINLEQDILQRNNLLAERNRGYFEAKNLFCLNLMSSPGSGKTTLLEETIRRLKAKRSIYVIEGDQQTSNDADRIAALEIPVFQVNTGMKRKRSPTIPPSVIMSLPSGLRTTAMRLSQGCFRERAVLSEKRRARESKNRSLPPILIPPFSACL